MVARQHCRTFDMQDTHTELVGSPSTAAPLTLFRMLGRFAGLRGVSPCPGLLSPARKTLIISLTLLSAKFERLDDLENRFQADLDNICETFNVERHSIKFEKWRTTL